MKLLLDTHTLLWLAENDPQLSKTAVEYLSDPANELLISPASYWELAIKLALGKYRLTDPLSVYLQEAIRLYDLSILCIDVLHAEGVANLPHHHRDLFDRMLIAQCIVEQLAVVSSDEAFDAYSIRRIW